MRLPLLVLGLAACAPPDTSALFTHVDLTVEEGGPDANRALADVIDSATASVEVALPGLEDPSLSDAILAAADRGVDVRVVFDKDSETQDGVRTIVDAGIPTTLADGGVGYFDFTLSADVAWTSDQVSMTHSFVLADGARWALASGAGDLGAGARVVFSGRGEDLGEDLHLEHNQVFGGTDATALDSYNAPSKSIPESRWLYPTQDDQRIEVWFNPQERDTKRIIDAVYAARASVRVLTEDFADPGLARALQRKAEDGFDVEVLVGSTFGQASGILSDVLTVQAPDVPLLRVTTTDPLPTIVFVDYDVARDGAYHHPTALVLSHPIISAARLFGGVPVVTDQLVDGTLVVLDADGPPTDAMQRLADVYRERLGTAEDLR